MSRQSALPWIDSTFSRWLAAVFLIFFQFGLSGVASAQSGVVAWKEQPFHADSTAKVFYFERMEKTGPVSWFFRGRHRMVLEPHQKFEVLFIPESVAELEGKMGSQQLREDFERLSAFATKYPAAGTLLKKRLDQIEMYLHNYEVASVKTDGEWMPVAEHDKLTAEARKTVAPPPLKPNHRTLVYVVCAVYLLVLLVFTLWRKRTPVLLLLVLPFIGAFGWFTYKDQGFGWVKRVNEELREAYQELGLP